MNQFVLVYVYTRYFVLGFQFN